MAEDIEEGAEPASELVTPGKANSQLHPAPPEDAPEELIPAASPKGDWVQATGSLQSSDFDATNLCLPSKSGTFLSILLAATFTFAGLLAFGLAERALSDSWRQLLRLVGWELMIYVPVMGVVQPILRNYLFYDLQPAQSLADAWPQEESGGSRSQRWMRILAVPCLQHLIAAACMSCLTFLQFKEEYLGLIPFCMVGFAFILLAVTLLLRFLGPPVAAESYAFPILPCVGAIPLMGAIGVMCAYVPLRQVGGAGIGLLMPVFLSCYEQFGSWMVTRRFLQKFMVDKEVRSAYSTNQGVVVSLAICNLHAMAEGVRLTLLYADNQNHGPAWVPIVSGVVWNVMSRVGCLDCFLHYVSRRRWKPNNISKLLRESGYCMGYPRFGAIVALILVRVCLGTSFAWDAPELIQLVLVVLAELVEDMISHALWRLGFDVSPEKHFATDQEVEIKVRRRLSRRLSQGSMKQVTPTEPSMKPTPSETEEMERWKVRVAHDFKFGPKDFGRLPLWAQFMPAAMAQFLTILSMIVVSGGVDILLGMCDASTSQTGVIWWNDAPCHAPCH